VTIVQGIETLERINGFLSHFFKFSLPLTPDNTRVMRNKLGTFSEFANLLYPHEADYLLSVQQFSKPDNLKILHLVNYNCKNPHNPIPFDASIDKRTYSYLKNWIEETLDKADVDKFYDWLLDTERQVMSDAITPDEEVELMLQATNTRPSRYYFIRFYQVMQHYRDYLLVRNRIRYYGQVSIYLETHHEAFVRSQNLNIEMNVAAEHVVKQLAVENNEFQQYEYFFKTIYFDESLDGYTRYRAAVRLTILYYTNRQFEKLSEIYQHLDLQFKTNLFYSKRILANFYHNRAMMHSKLQQFDIAEKYGYLSIRQKNSDYLFYLVSLCDILLRTNKNAEALNILSESVPELKKTNNYHSKIGFASFYIKALLANNQVNKAVGYATTYFESYRKEIFQFRWHLFFTSFFQALMREEKYSKILSLTHRYKLVTKEKTFLGKAAYMPVIQWYVILSEYMEGKISKENFVQTIVTSCLPAMESTFKSQRIFEMLAIFELTAPDLVKEILRQLNARIKSTKSHKYI
jgi:hypothetical protein